MVLGVFARFGAWRRTAATAAVVGASLVGTAMATSAPSGAQSAGFNNGRGASIAQSIRLDPVAGGLSFGVGVGEALAGHQNTVGTAESRAVNTGVIGTTLAGQGCDGGDPTLPKEQQPQPLRADSSQDGPTQSSTSPGSTMRSPSWEVNASRAVGTSNSTVADSPAARVTR